MSQPTPTETGPPQIEMIDLAAAHEQAPGVPAIEGVNWRVGAGEFWVVGGLHSSGKSVLLTAAAGINRPLRGKLQLFGGDPTTLDEEEAFRRLLRVGLVFEGDGRLFTHMTVAENIALPLLYHAACASASVSPARSLSPPRSCWWTTPSRACRSAKRVGGSISSGKSPPATPSPAAGP